MPEYVALIWDSCDSDAAFRVGRMKSSLRQFRPNWTTAIDHHGMFLVHAPLCWPNVDTSYPLVGGRGSIMGRLFERAYLEGGGRCAPRPVIFDDKISRAIVDTGGMALRDKFWGRYIGFLSDVDTQKKYVLRDPTGTIPCQETTIDRISCYFARLCDVEILDRLSLSINRHFIVAYLAAPAAYSEETGYSGITTVLPGQRVVHHRGGTRRDFYWDPVQLGTSANEVASQLVAEDDTRRIVQAGVYAWAACFESISLQLSGGLDSAVVAACLASAPTKPHVTAVNFYSNRDSADERAYAREVAAHAGFELIEIADSDHCDLDLTTPVDKTVIPRFIQTTSSAWVEMWDLLKSRGASCHMRGDGGDELFHRSGRLPDAVDLAYRDGISRRLFAVAHNDAMIEEMSIWGVLRLAAIHGTMRRTYDWRRLRAITSSPLLSDDVRSEIAKDDTFWHPLYRVIDDVPPAKLNQSFRLLPFTSNYYFGPRQGNELQSIAPLISQPHLEFALKTPLHVLRHGGRDRSLARSAFENEIPRRVAYRKTKGLTTMPVGQWLSKNAGVVREILLGGYLARAQILNVRSLEDLLAKGEASGGGAAPLLMGFMCIEVWVRDAIAQAARAA
jgi:asparagine synthase (glutamine-hydrolysing)